MNTAETLRPAFDYFYGSEHEQYLYLQIPIALIKDPLFKPLSGDAKLLYGLLLNRTSLSAKNGWRDEHNRVYIIYTVEEIMNDLNCWESKATKSMKELTSLGLVKSVRRGLGKPNLLYVMNFASALKPNGPPETATPEVAAAPSAPPETAPPDAIPAEENPAQFLNCENRNSGIVNPATLELRKSQSSNLYISNIYSRELSPVSSVCPIGDEAETTDGQTGQDTTSYPVHNDGEKGQKKGKPVPNRPSPIKTNQEDYTQLEAKIKAQIYYDQLMKDFRFKQREIDELTNIMIDVCMTTSPTLRIDGENKPRSLVLGVYEKVRYEHIIHTIEQFDSQTVPISRKKKYLITTLFNAVHELTSRNNNRFNTGEFT